MLIKKRRLELHLTQAALARRSGCDAQTISNIECGCTTRMHNSVAEKIAGALGMSLNDFVDQAQSFATSPVDLLAARFRLTRTAVAERCCEWVSRQSEEVARAIVEIQTPAPSQQPASAATEEIVRPPQPPAPPRARGNVTATRAPRKQSRQMQERPAERLLTLERAAAQLKVSYSTVRRFCVSGELPWITVGHASRYPRRRIAQSSVEDFRRRCGIENGGLASP